jgi:hypothetical protein
MPEQANQPNKPESTKTKKSLSVIDVLDNGDLYIETGSPSNVITQLGQKVTGGFKPYANKVSGVVLYYPYVVSKDFVPASYKSSDEFIQLLEAQSSTNKYVQKWIELGAQSIRDYLRRVGIIDTTTKFIYVKNTKIGDVYANDVSNGKVFATIVSKDEVTKDDLTLAKDAPQDAKDHFEPLLQQLDREDVSFNIDDLNLTKKEYELFDGFLDFSDENVLSLTSDEEVILITDYVSSFVALKEATRRLSEQGVNVVAHTCLLRKKS